MTARHTSLEMLRAAHPFPCRFVFKIIGPGDAAFVARVLQVPVLVLGPQCVPEVSVRQSSGGRHQAVTLAFQVASAEQVLELYHHFGSLDGVRLLL